MVGSNLVGVSTLVRRSALFLLLLSVLGTLGGCYLFVDDPEVPPPAAVEASEGVYLDSVRVSWEEVAGASRYEVQRAPEEDGRYSLLGTTTDSTFEDTNVELGQEYWYRVRGIVAGERGVWSDPVMGYPGEPEDPPGTPTGVRASTGDHTNKIVIRWDQVEGATSYEIYRRGDGKESFSKVADTTSTTYEDHVSAGKGYWYRIRACSDAGCSQLSASAWGFAEVGPGEDDPPARPRWVEATEGEYDDKVRVTWSPSTGATHYEIYRADEDDEPLDLLDEDANGYVRIGESDEPQYDDFDVDACQEYWYRIRACNEAGCSSLSRADSGHRGTSMDDVFSPTGLTASYRTYADRIELSWNEVSGAVEYELRYESDGDDGTITVDGTSYAHEYDHGEGVPAAETEYEYRVRAWGVDACGHTDWSQADTGVRTGAPPSPNLTDIDRETVDEDDDERTHEVTLTWTWTWKPDESPNPVDDFVIFRRRGAAGFSEHATADAEVVATDDNGDKYEKGVLKYEPADEDDDPVEVEYTFTWTEVITVEEETSFTYRLRARAEFGDPDHVVEETRSSASNSRSVTLSGP